MIGNYYSYIWQTQLVAEYKSKYNSKKHSGFGSKCKSCINLPVQCQELTASALAYFI